MARSRFPYWPVVVGALLLVASGVAYLVSRSFAERALPTIGHVVDMDCHTDEDGDRLCAPVAEYTTPDEVGRYQVTYSVSSTSPAYDVGDPVVILYDPNDPGYSYFDGFADLWLFPLIFLIGGLVFLGVGWAPWSRIRKRPHHANVVARIAAALVGVAGLVTAVGAVGQWSEGAIGACVALWPLALIYGGFLVLRAMKGAGVGLRVLFGEALYGLPVAAALAALAMLLVPLHLQGYVAAAAPLGVALLLPMYARLGFELEARLASGRLRKDWDRALEAAREEADARGGLVVEVVDSAQHELTLRQVGDVVTTIPASRDAFRSMRPDDGEHYLLAGVRMDERATTATQGYRSVETESYLADASETRLLGRPPQDERYVAPRWLPWGVPLVLAMSLLGVLGGAVVLDIPVVAPSQQLDRSYELAGTVESAKGSALAVGSGCVVSIVPNAGRFNCRVIVSCEGTALYGATESTGFTRCVLGDDGEPISALDPSADDGDPALTFDAGDQVVEVRTSGQSTTIRLEPVL